MQAIIEIQQLLKKHLHRFRMSQVQRIDALISPFDSRQPSTVCPELMQVTDTEHKTTISTKACVSYFSVVEFNNITALPLIALEKSILPAVVFDVLNF